MIQNITFHIVPLSPLFLSNRKSRLESGAKQKKNGHAAVQSLKTPPVPIRFCNGGKTKRSQRACELPLMERNIDISLGGKEKPPREIGVNQNTGATVLEEKIVLILDQLHRAR
jgi:hypothetical protein